MADWSELSRYVDVQSITLNHMFDRARDAKIRVAIFEWLMRWSETNGDVFPRRVLAEGLIVEATKTPLVGPKGIFKPKILGAAPPLSITTAPNGPYDDTHTSDGFLCYRFRGIDPNHPDNVGLREALKLQIPLVHFFGIATGKYVASWPVFVISEDVNDLAFTVAIDDRNFVGKFLNQNVSDSIVRESPDLARRAYITSTVRIRLHQRAFRERVLDAYRRECSFCKLRHEDLLDAAHIIADSNPLGEPIVNNGLALCSLHHKAFDRGYLGLRPDLIIEVRPDILKESDGPTLVHGIQRLHGLQLNLPRSKANWPDKGLVEKRFEQFKQAIGF